MTAAVRASARRERDAEALTSVPRILPRPPATGLSDHVARYGPLPRWGASLLPEVAGAGLRGRGGAGFPTATKMRAVAERTSRGWRRDPGIVVANGTESEPASAKDKVLLRVSPHLVLDGIVAAADAVGADRGAVCIDRRDREAIAAVDRAIAERRGRDPIALSTAGAPSRYTAGEETALVSWLNGGEAKPTFVPPRPFERGVGGSPTLVDNVETLANLGVIARTGGAAWRSVGDLEDPGSRLVTVTGAVGTPGVYEVESGMPVSALLARANAAEPAGVLVGGYYGSWLKPEQALRAAMSIPGLAPFGASPGCGLLAVIPEDHCPLQEVAAVAGWLASSSAGQCGPCRNGLPAMAGAMAELVAGDRDGSASSRLDRWSPMITGRGACGLPDGAVRFVDSARQVFVAHIQAHRRHGPCPPNPRRLLPVPHPGGWR